MVGTMMKEEEEEEGKEGDVTMTMAAHLDGPCADMSSQPSCEQRAGGLSRQSWALKGGTTQGTWVIGEEKPRGLSLGRTLAFFFTLQPAAAAPRGLARRPWGFLGAVGSGAFVGGVRKARVRWRSWCHRRCVLGAFLCMEGALCWRRWELQ